MYKQLEVTDNEHFEGNEIMMRKSIEEFTAFVKNHSFIKIHFKADELYILGFLRARRYVMPKAKELFERSCLFIKQNPEICIFNEELFVKSFELYDTGVIMVMKERDALGRRIIICVTRKFDPSKFTVDDSLRLFSIILYTLFFEEETQKNGIVFINDLKGVNISHMKLFPYKMLKNYTSYMNVCAIRVKEIYAVGMPSIAVQIFKAIQYVIDDKIKGRLKVMSDVSKLWNFVNQSLMTKEHGGASYSEAEVLTDFKKLIIQHKDEIITNANNIEIDMEKAKKFHKIKTSHSKSKNDGDSLLEFD